MVNSPYANIVPIVIIARIFRKKIIILHQADFILPKGLKNKVLEGIYYICSLASFALSSKVATWNRDYAENSAVLKPFLSKFQALPLPICFPVMTKSKGLKKLYQLKKEGKIVFGFAGRFVEEKGFDILFDAIPEVIKKNSNIHFVYAGETNIKYENFFKLNFPKYNRVKNHILLLGLLGENDLINFYKTIDFLIVPSRSDAFPLVQAEAVYNGTPVITSNIPGARHLIRETGYGFLFEKENIKDLTRKILKANNKKKILIKNYRKVKKFFDSRKTMEAFINFIEQ